MKRTVNLVDKLDLPDPPANHFWRIGERAYIGTTLRLYKSHRFWFPTKSEEFALVVIGSQVSLRDKLELAAQILLRKYYRDKKLQAEVDALYR